MIRDTAFKTNGFCIKDMANRDAIPCNLNFEHIHFALQPHQAGFNQHFPEY